MAMEPLDRFEWQIPVASIYPKRWAWVLVKGSYRLRPGQIPSRMLLIAVVVVVAATYLAWNDWRTLVLLPIGIALGLLLRWAMAVRKLRATPQFMVDQAAVLAADGVVMTSSYGSNQSDWSAWESVRATGDFVVVTNRAGNPLLLPNDALVAGPPPAELISIIQRWIDAASIAR